MEGAREMTRQELISENNRLRAENARLRELYTSMRGVLCKVERLSSDAILTESEFHTALGVSCKI